MSARQIFALCIDCWEFHYGIPDANGVYSRDSGSSNHFDHAVHVFGAPNEYSTSFEKPIQTALLDLQRGIPISDARADMLSLACAITAIQPNNGRTVHGADTPLGAVELYQRRKPQPTPGADHPDSCNDCELTPPPLFEVTT